MLAGESRASTIFLASHSAAVLDSPRVMPFYAPAGAVQLSPGLARVFAGLPGDRVFVFPNPGSGLNKSAIYFNPLPGLGLWGGTGRVGLGWAERLPGAK